MSAEPDRLTIVQWNLENVFDAVDDPANPMDDEFTESSWRRWTDDLYRLKLRHLAEAIDELDGDICCLQELESRSVVDDLVATIRTEHGRHYEYIVHRESTDHRGIDLAVLSNVKPASIHWLTPVAEQRDILVTRFEPGGRALTIVVNHWKSRWGGVEATAPLRMKQAKAVRREIDAVFDEDPKAAVLVVGDFNDNFDEASLVEGLKSTPVLAAVNADRKGRFLYNLHGSLPSVQRGTFYYRRGKTWNSFDTMSVSRSMLSGSTGDGWRVAKGAYEVARLPKLVTEAGTPKSFRRFKNKATGKWAYQEGYSDHFPVRVTLER
jgi:endonuclease/exonuclease/phosphatase family metal-dependent hydrolase